MTTDRRSSVLRNDARAAASLLRVPVAIGAVLGGAAAVASADPPDAAATVWRNATADVLPMAATNGRSMDAEFADLDGDGRLDLVIASEFGQNVVLLGRADGRLVLEHGVLEQGRRHDSEDIAIADVDGDGRLDLVFAAEDDRTNELHLQASAGRFRDATGALAAGGVSNCVAALDGDGDGDVDLVFGNSGESTVPGQGALGGANTVYLNDGRGGFTPGPADMLPGDVKSTQDLEFGDLDGDGDLDLICGNEDGHAILRRDGDRFTDVTAEWAPANAVRVETREVDLGDLDGDGDLDAVFANVGWRTGVDSANRLWLNDGTGRFTEAGPDHLQVIREFTLDVDLGDLDGDGDLDLVFGNVPGASGPTLPVRVLLNDGDARFRDVTNQWMPLLGFCHVIDVELADLDGDGRLDLYLANHVSSDFVLLTGEPRAD